MLKPTGETKDTPFSALNHPHKLYTTYTLGSVSWRHTGGRFDGHIPNFSLPI